MTVRRLAAIAASLVAIVPAARADSVDVAIEKAIGGALVTSIEGASGVVRDPLLLNWLETITAPLVRATPKGPLRPRFVLLDSAVANAWTAPGGTVLVTRGLIESVGSDDELAAVLGHELAHVAKRHAWQQLSENAIALAALRFVKDQTLRSALIGGNILRTLGRSRAMESQADTVGVGITADAGYDPRGMASFLGGFRQKSESSLLAYLSTHPSPARRVEALERQEGFSRAAPESRARLASHLRARGLPEAARRVEAGDDPLNLPPLTPATLGPELAAERRSVVQRSESALGQLRKSASGQAIAGSLQQLLLIQTPLNDLRFLYLAARAYAVQQRVSDVLARTGRTLSAAPGVWDRLSESDGVEARVGRGEARFAIDRAAEAPSHAKKAATAVGLVLADLNTRLIRTRRDDQKWVRAAAIEGLLRLAEAELGKAEASADRGWESLSMARIRAYMAALDRLAPEGDASRRRLWSGLATRRFGRAPEGSGLAGAATVRAALAAQRDQSETDAEQGRGSVDWADWVRQRGEVGAVATQLRLLTLDLERETIERR